MKKRFAERNTDITEAFDKITGPNSKFMDDASLRDEFFRRNLIVPIDDVQRTLREISREDKNYVSNFTKQNISFVKKSYVLLYLKGRSLRAPRYNVVH